MISTYGIYMAHIYTAIYRSLNSSTVLLGQSVPCTLPSLCPLLRLCPPKSVPTDARSSLAQVCRPTIPD